MLADISSDNLPPCRLCQIVGPGDGQAAGGDIESARQTLDRVPPVHPFQNRYMPIAQVEWESCNQDIQKSVPLLGRYDLHELNPIRVGRGMSRRDQLATIEIH